MNLNKLLKIGRASDWWEYKIPPLLAIAYATIIKNESIFIEMIPHLLFLLLALGLGAVYAYTINDLTDIEEDRAAGKSNQMAKIKPKYRWMIPLGFFLGGFSLFCVFIYRGDYLSGFIYGLPCVCFSLYSFRPFRLKEKGIWGVLMDALGAHFFLSLLMISSLSYVANVPIDWLWFGLVGAWSLIFGIRGILWHQFQDRDRDIKAGTVTFATTININRFKKHEIPFIFTELSLLLGILFIIGSTIVSVALLLYVILAILRYLIQDYKVVLILNSRSYNIQIAMLDFYVAFFPIALLFQAYLTEATVLVLLGIHVLLFPQKVVNILRDFKIISARLTKAILTLL